MKTPLDVKNDVENHIRESRFLYKEIQLQALEVLRKTQLPSNQEESWRKVKLNLIPFDEWDWNHSSLDTQIHNAKDQSALYISFVEEFLKINFDSKLSKSYQFSVDFFSILNVVYLQNLQLIYIPSNQKRQIQIIHKAKEGNTFFPFTIVIVDSGAEAWITEKIIGKDQLSIWSTSTYILANPDTKIHYTSIREHSDSDFHFHRIRTIQKRDSYVHTSTFHTGGILGKGFVQARLLEENTEYRGIGFFFGEKGFFHNMEMDIQHHNHYETSSILYKSIVKDRAHSVFIGKLETLPKLKGVNSHQLNQNLILSKKAKAESMPWLIVRSEDVSCEHGATTGELDEEALFYLKIRGLTEQEAKKLLMIGFIYDLIQESSLTEEEKESFIYTITKKL